MKFNITTFLVLALAMAVTADTDDEKWDKFKARFNRTYSPKEEAMRKVQFMKSQREIEKHNSENHPWKADHNEFSDKTDDEKKTRLGGRDNGNREVNLNSQLSLELDADSRQLPTQLDLRTSSCMPAIKDQGQCGSCWAFAAIAAVEYAKCKKAGSLVRLSEQQLVDCDTSSYGCNGGYYTYAWDKYLKSSGSMTETCYPYKSGTTKVAGTCAYKATGVNAYTSGYGWVDWVNGDNTLIMKALNERGVLTTALFVQNSFFSYSSGVYDDATCPNNTINHAVNIVGYGTNTNGILYWVGRNSWGTWWGQSGYFMIRRGVNRCNIEKNAAYVTVV